MGRIQNIIDEITMVDADLESALLQCRVVARQLKYKPLEDWANKELDGYSGVEDLPKYRVFESTPRGYYTNGPWSVPNKPVDPHIVGQDIYDQMRTVPITSGIKSLVAQRNQGDLSIHLHQYEGGVNSLYAAQVSGGYGFINLHVPVPPGAFDSVIGAVRNNLLSLLLDMTDIFPNEQDLSNPSVRQRSQIEKSFAHNIYNITNSGDIVIGNDTQLHKATLSIQVDITPGSIEELSRFLVGEGLNVDDVREIEPLLGYVFEGKLAPEQASTLQTWVQKMAEKMSSGAKSVSKEVATSTIAQALIGFAPNAATIINELLG